MSETEEKKEVNSEEAPKLPPVDVYSMLGYFVSMLTSYTWQWLGLVKNPDTGELVKDLAQAKVAIDTVTTLAAQLEVKLSPAEKNEMNAMLNDLRLNYVQQSSKES